MKKKELQNLLSNHDQSYQSLQASLITYTKNGPQNRDKFNRNPHGGNNRMAAGHGLPQADGATGQNNQNDGLTPLKGGKDVSGVGIRG